ncbi:MAG: hypothetical protein LWX07_13125 [Bacteroidetes bacterium]|nr:hypothetical protein [Bacteroidota bacterium]
MEILIKKIISGGQTGADRGGLDAAKELGIPTGGHCPKNFKTETGHDRALADYGLVETDSENYEERTILNVTNSDGTVIFCNVDENGLIIGEGTMFTFYTAESMFRPVIVNPDEKNFLAWLNENGIHVLNVAGNRESLSPGMHENARHFLVKALSKTMKSRGKKLYEVFLFAKEIEKIKNDNYSGSAALLLSLINALISFLDNSQNLSAEDVAREIEINLSGPVKKHSQLVVLKNFFDELESKLKKYSNVVSFRKKMTDYLAAYRDKWNKVNDRIAAVAMRSLDFKNKTILLHSNSSTIVKLFEKLAEKNIKVKVVQCESRPVLEGRRQAKKIAALGFPVTLIADSSVMNYADEIDFALLGTDGIFNNFFLNKIGSYFIALGMKEMKKPLYVLTDSRKIDSSQGIARLPFVKIIPPEIHHPQGELWGEKIDNIKVENLYFERVPLKYVKKVITEK